MKAKGFFIAVVAVALALLILLTAVVAAVDPLFSLNGVDRGETAVFANQRYEMAGLIRHQDYSAVVMGTSLVANFRASWFEEGLDEKVLKITFPDGWISEFDTALTLAYETHPELNRVFFCLDPNILIRSDEERTVELPAYLYNNNPLDDAEFYLNADSVMLAAETVVARLRGEGSDLDSAYIWDGTVGFSRTQALASYPRPERAADTDLPEDTYLAACEENLSVILGWIEEHPDTEFTIWFPPYSVLYWDKMTREGREGAVLAAVEHAARRLLSCKNVTVHCFAFDYVTITDLHLYTDHIHCCSAVTEGMARRMLAGEWLLTEENYKIRLDELREFVANYDYDSLFDD